MSVIKVFRDLDGLFNYSTDENPTSQQDYQKAVKNWVKTIVSLVDSNLWQPETEYVVGDTVKTPSLSKGAVLYCLEAGTTGAAEPDYTDMGIGDIITDGTVTWSLIQQTATAGTYLPLSGGTVTGDLAVTGTLDGTASGNLPLSGGNITGDLSVTGTITGNVTGNVTGNADTATNATNDANGNPIASTYLPAVVGAVVAFAGSTTPQGWLLCDGSAVSRTDYAALYAVIGTTYGAGDGSTTFNLPNLVDKFAEGSATAGTVKSAGLPNITGTFQTRYPWDGAADAATGAFKSPPTSSPTYAQEGTNNQLNYNTVSFNANKSNSVYGNSTTVQPPALTMRYIIKY